jgi:tripartite-type tricarboxylate transporter receptor subunit TctC
MNTPLLICVLSAFLFPGWASAQSWPEKPVRVVVPYAAGGNTDSIARIAAQQLSIALGQQFVVDNRAGAGGAIAAEHVARAAPDGYTILFGSLAPISILPLIRRVPYDPVKDFVPISIVGTNYFILGVNANLPVKTLKEFIDHVKTRPGLLNYASGGTGTVSHVTGAMFLSRANLRMTHVPYKGGAPAVADLIGGQVQMYFGNAAEILPHATTGKVRALAVSSARRDPKRPELAAIAEDFPGFSAVTWNGPMAPAGTPRFIVERLAKAIADAVQEPQVIASLGKIGVDPLGNTPAQFSELIRTEQAFWRSAVEAAGIQQE